MDKRDIGQEILDGLKAIKRGEGKHIEHDEPDVREIRSNMGLSQSAFAALLGVSPRTLQDWEQGRRAPKGPAKSLLRVADKHPEALLA